MSALDTQVGGSHYSKLAIQPMQYSMANNLDACQHTIVKYVTRFRDKGGIADLEKARHVIDMLIEFEQIAAENEKREAEEQAQFRHDVNTIAGWGLHEISALSPFDPITYGCNACGKCNPVHDTGNDVSQ